MPSAAGPSRARRRSASPPYGDRSQNHSQSQTQRRRKSMDRRREQVFEEQDPDQHHKVGQDYRTLQSRADDMKTNLENIGAADVQAMMKQQDRLFRNVKDTGLANLDARVLQTTTEVSANLVRKMKLTSATFDVDEFLVHVGAALGLDKQQPEDVDADDNSDSDIDELEDEAEATQRRQERVAARGRRGGVLGDWAKIGWMAAGLYRRVPGVEFMYGPVSVQHTKRTVARRRARADLAPETRPQEVDTQDPKKNKDITLQNTIQIVKVLSRIDPERKGVNYFRLLVNPHDFGQTVENIFYASFLVRDGKMGIEVNEDDGEVVARLMEPADPEVDGDVPKNQTIIELDMEAWDEAIKLFGITESAIPNRAPAQTQVGSSGWYGA